MKSPLYTIGYARLSPSRLREIASGLGTVVVDCRFNPRSRRPGFGRAQLSQLLGDCYRWEGLTLGGFGNVTQQGIRCVRELLRKRPVLLLCKEAEPGDCHRHRDICVRHFPDALHIYEDELIRASELQRAVDDDDEYRVAGSLSRRLATLRGNCMTTVKWKYATTYADAPHWYVLRKQYPEFFARFEQLIRKHGVREQYSLRGKTATYKYFYRGRFRYWTMWPGILNRCVARRRAAGN